jgi:hypothetical protein
VQACDYTKNRLHPGRADMKKDIVVCKPATSYEPRNSGSGVTADVRKRSDASTAI